MATGGDSHVLNCAICFENKTNKNPRGLPCQHSFCLSCIQQWHSTRVSQGKEDQVSVECPVCRQKSNLPSGGIVSLPVDFKVAEVTDMMTGFKIEFLCQKCSQDGLSKPMKALCKTCNRRLCEDCISRHKQVKIFASHIILDDLCKDHKAAVEYFCLTCKERLCTDCVISDRHQGHEIADLIQAEQIVKKEIMSKQRELDKQVDVLEERISREVSMVKNFDVFVEAVTRHHLEELKKELDDRFSKLAKIHKDKHQKAFQKLYEQYKSKCMNARSLSKKLDTIRGGKKLTHDTDIQTIYRELNQMLNLAGSQINIPEARLFSVATCSITGIDTVKDAIRHCSLSCNMSNLTEDMNEMAVPQFVLRIPCGSGQATKSAGQIRVLPDGSAVVIDYDGYPCRYNTDGEHVKTYSGKSGICAICVDKGNIYLSTRRSDMMIKIAPGGSEYHISIGKVVSSTHQIQVDNNSLYILHSGCIDLINLSNTSTRKRVINSQGICSFVRVPTGTSNRFFCVNEEKNIVEVFDESGDRLYTIGGPETPAGPFRCPSDVKVLAIGNIIVSDLGNDRIVEFRVDGHIVRELLTRNQGIHQPNDMDYIHPYLWIKEGSYLPGTSISLFKFG